MLSRGSDTMFRGQRLSAFLAYANHVFPHGDERRVVQRTATANALDAVLDLGRVVQRVLLHLDCVRFAEPALCHPRTLHRGHDAKRGSGGNQSLSTSYRQEAGHRLPHEDDTQEVGASKAAFQVWGPTMPSTSRCCSAWNCVVTFLDCSPYTPSIRKPISAR